MHCARARFNADSGTAQRAFLLHHLLPPGETGAQGSAPGPESKRRALESLQALNRNFSAGSPGFFHDRHYGAPISWFAPTAAVWSQSQGIGAGLDTAKLTGNPREARAMLGALDAYSAQYYRSFRIENPTGVQSRFAAPTIKFEGRPMLAYAPGTGGSASSKGVGRTLYYDDNSWIGIDLLQAYRQTRDPTYLHKAEALYPFLSSGQQPHGGLIWSTSSPENRVNMPATGASTEYALRLYQATRNPTYLRFATKNIDFMNRYLRSPSGLYYDDTQPGRVSGKQAWVPTKKIYSYNQGTAIGSNLLYYQVTHDKRYLDAAKSTASASLDYFKQADSRGETRLWHQPPAFNAIYFRNLLQLDRVAPDPAYRQSLNDYLNAAWDRGRDPKSGLFTRGGIGSYGAPGNYLDQAALVQLYALADWPAHDLSQVG